MLQRSRNLFLMPATMAAFGVLCAAASFALG